jgi:hypothetical protein
MTRSVFNDIVEACDVVNSFEWDPEWDVKFDSLIDLDSRQVFRYTGCGTKKSESMLRESGCFVGSYNSPEDYRKHFRVDRDKLIDWYRGKDLVSLLCGDSELEVFMLYLNVFFIVKFCPDKLDNPRMLGKLARICNHYGVQPEAFVRRVGLMRLFMGTEKEIGIMEIPKFVGFIKD